MLVWFDPKHVAAPAPPAASDALPQVTLGAPTDRGGGKAGEVAGDEDPTPASTPEKSTP